MIRFIVAAVWLCGVTLGALFFAFSSAKDGGDAEAAQAAPHFGGLDYVKTDVISVPIVKGGAVDGYFLARFVYTVDPVRKAQMSVPADALLADEVFTYVYGNPLFDFSETGKVDMDGFRNGLMETVNARVGEKLIHEVLVEQVDYLSKQEIRDNAVRRRSAAPAAPAPAIPAAGDH